MKLNLHSTMPVRVQYIYFIHIFRSEKYCFKITLFESDLIQVDIFILIWVSQLRRL